jgi:hypothetical protein
MNTLRPNTHQKAFRINLDAEKHGTFAEIGAGQEVARVFFQVGGAAATVAKTICAYDMAISDAIYGPTERYVSQHRLIAMLDHEYDLLLERLFQKRGADTTFFVFADTVATRSFSHHEEGNGWLGMRFQHQPGAQPSEIIIHVRLLDAENVREQEALGIAGVNLIYGAFYHRDDPKSLITSLMDDLAQDRLEIDMIKFSGPCFAAVDNRLMSLQLVELGFTGAAVFNGAGEVVHPSEVLHKKPVMILRGGFRPVTNTVLDMIERSQRRFQAKFRDLPEDPVVIMEMSLKNLMSAKRIEHPDFLARVDILGALGKTVMISNFAQHYSIASFLGHYTTKSVVFVLGIPGLKELFDEKYYADLEGGILEAFGGLFRKNVTLCVYPSKDPATGRIITAENFAVAPRLQHLYTYLSENGFLESIREVDESQLEIQPGDVLARIQIDDPSWETMVPAVVAQRIREHRLFGYRPSSGGNAGS